jgi:hypothetical protein
VNLQWSSTYGNIPRVTTRLAAACLAAALALGCGKWTSDEQTQIDAFRTSVVKAQEATGGQGAGVALAPEAIGRASAAVREAIAAADTVTDPLLARLHPELPVQYRTRFVPGLRLRLEALEALAAGAPITARELEWQVLMAEWGDWYERALPTLRQNIGG